MDQWQQWGKQIYPGSKWIPLQRNHSLSFSFYLLEKRMFLRYSDIPLFLLEKDDRAIMILNRSARWSWQQFRDSSLQISGNTAENEVRLRFYINLLMYLLTGNYKNDQLHLPTILLRRR